MQHDSMMCVHPCCSCCSADARNSTFVLVVAAVFWCCCCCCCSAATVLPPLLLAIRRLHGPLRPVACRLMLCAHHISTAADTRPDRQLASEPGAVYCCSASSTVRHTSYSSNRCKNTYHYSCRVHLLKFEVRSEEAQGGQQEGCWRGWLNDRQEKQGRTLRTRHARQFIYYTFLQVRMQRGSKSVTGPASLAILTHPRRFRSHSLLA
jgi:hypothetical protein